jgi:hypothetical protein
MRVKIAKHCRICSLVPPKGFWPSRAKRYDWICPDCCQKSACERRKEGKPEETHANVQA